MNRAIVFFTGLMVCMNGYAIERDANTYQTTVGLGFDHGLSAILDIDQHYRFVLGNDGGAFDYIMQRGRFDDSTIPFNWYAGAGVWTAWDKDENLGVRAPVGVNWLYRERINFYAQVHPELVLHDDLKLHLGGAVGITYKF